VQRISARDGGVWVDLLEHLGEGVEELRHASGLCGRGNPAHRIRQSALPLIPIAIIKAAKSPKRDILAVSMSVLPSTKVAEIAFRSRTVLRSLNWPGSLDGTTPLRNFASAVTHTTRTFTPDFGMRMPVFTKTAAPIPESSLLGCLRHVFIPRWQVLQRTAWIGWFESICSTRKSSGVNG